MKAKKIAELKTNFSFEAPFINASELDANKEYDVKSRLDLNRLMAPNSGKIYLVRVNGESMIDENIFHGDILVVDKDEKPKDGKVVIAALNGELAVKTYRKLGEKVYLFSANEKFLPIEIKPFWQFEIQGVVKYVIHDV